jgi:hypothetical protein
MVRNKFQLLIKNERTAMHFLFILLFFFTIINQAHSSAFKDHDTTYFQTYPTNITGRFFFSQKYTRLEIESQNDNQKRLRYDPNTTFNMGIGATYKNFTLNLAYGFKFLNKEQENKGNTDYLDLQFHFYPRKWSIDGFSQNYYGYYLSPKGFLADNPESYYLRPDLKVNLIGVALYRVVNDKKFSYKAALIQNEWQRKSAGSLLLGAEFYYGNIRADSALVPSNVSGFYDQTRINKFHFVEIGPGVGYAYTFVLPYNLFFTGSLTFNPSLSYVTEVSPEGRLNNFIIDPNAFLRFAAGYSDGLWNAGISWLNNYVSATGASKNHYSLSTGNFRITVARRFEPSSKGFMRRIDKVFE